MSTAFAARTDERRPDMASMLREQGGVALQALVLALDAPTPIAGHAAMSPHAEADGLERLHTWLVRIVLRCATTLFAESRGLVGETASLSALYAELRDRSQTEDGGLGECRGAWQRLQGSLAWLDGGSGREPRASGSPGGLFGPHPLDAAAKCATPPDAVAYRLLDALLGHEGAGVEYAALDIEHLGDIYEGLMGCRLISADGALRLQASEARRSSGSHYTPRELTSPIVASALRPILERLGPEPSPDQILELRLCDPAMGAGAFLIEACRQLAERLVAAWRRTGVLPGLRRAADPELLARRLVARQCLYGVDTNALAVDLARASLWVLARAGASPRGDGCGAFRCDDSLLLSWKEGFSGIFARPNGGFDCIVGNPPFLGGKRICTALGAAYSHRLAALHQGANRNADLVAHFFRRAFDLLRDGGTLGLVATNTVCQGDTRAAGLRWICAHGGTIYEAARRRRWPKEAAVIVSVVHIAKNWPVRPRYLDGQEVDEITAFLFHAGGHDDPARLRENAGKSFIGCFVRGMGFTFDDGSAAATPVAEMHRIVQKDPRNQTRIFPYIGGEEVNSSPTHAHHRYVIHFGGAREVALSDFPDLLAIVERKVRPGRERLGDSTVDRAHKRAWWRFANDRPELQRAIRGLARVLVIPRVSQHLSAVFLDPRLVFSDQLVVFPLAAYADFALLQGRVHETWARFFASTLGDGLRYNPSDCFETFPFPPAGTRAALEHVGKQYYERRAALLVARGEGLTKAYNRFHDPDERSSDIATLRALHARMDQAALDAYGWSDVVPEYGFSRQLDGRIRLGWGHETRDRVLERLLALNRARAVTELEHTPRAAPRARPRRRS